MNKTKTKILLLAGLGVIVSCISLLLAKKYKKKRSISWHWRDPESHDPTLAKKAGYAERAK